MSHKQSVGQRGWARSGRFVRAAIMASIVLTAALIVWTSALPRTVAIGGDASSLVAPALLLGVIGLMGAAVIAYLVRPAEVPER